MGIEHVCLCLIRNRFNIGIRSLEQEVTMTVTLYAGSAVVKSVSVSYPTNDFVQIPAGDLLGVSIGASQALIFSVDSGSAIVYGATVESSGARMTLKIASPSPSSSRSAVGWRAARSCKPYQEALRVCGLCASSGLFRSSFQIASTAARA